MHHVILVIVSIILFICIYHYFSPVKEGLKKPKNPFAGILKQIKKPIDDIFNKIMKPITTIIDTIKCAIKLVINIPKCMLYYVLDILGFIFYLPISILFWVFGAEKIEIQLWKGIYSIDTMVYEQSGYHIFHWSNDIMNKCYRCVEKKSKKIAQKSINPITPEPNIDMSASDTNSDAAVPKTVFIVVFLLMFWFIILYISFRTFRRICRLIFGSIFVIPFFMIQTINTYVESLYKSVNPNQISAYSEKPINPLYR
jgi:hypothetical protein